MTQFGRRPGDMFKADYDPDEDGFVTAAEAHKTSHQNQGDDELSLAGLSGESADAQPSSWAKVAGKPSTFAPVAHAGAHQAGGADQVVATGLVGRINYVDRGDPSAQDFQDSDLTTNGALEPLDLSSIIPAGALLAHITGYITHMAVGTYIAFVSSASVYLLNSLYARVQVASLNSHFDGFVLLDADRKIQYQATNTSIQAISITVRGWFI